MNRFVTFSLVALMALGVACDKGSKGATVLVSTLSGASEVPASGSPATGATGFEVRGSTVIYSLELHGISGVTAAHIHSGPAGVNGPVRVFLYRGSLSGSGAVEGVLVAGSFTAADVTGVSFSDLVAQMQAGTAYVNVHTVAKPGGEVRGQVQLVSSN